MRKDLWKPDREEKVLFGVNLSKWDISLLSRLVHQKIRSGELPECDYEKAERTAWRLDAARDNAEQSFKDVFKRGEE